MKTKIKLVLLLLAVAFSLTSCTQSRSEGKSVNTQTKNVNVRLAWLHQAQFAGIYVANKKGFYSNANLSVQLKEYEEGVDQTKELLDGAIDFSVMSPVEFLSSVSKGSQLKAIGVIYQQSPYAFASLKTKKITTPAEFKGKTLGKKGGNNEAAVTYLALLGKYKINVDDVKITDIDFEMDEGQDLVKGRADVIDLYRTDQTYLLNKEGIQYNLIYPEKYGFERYGDVLVTTAKKITDDPETVRKFVQATFSGWEEALKNKDETVQTTLEYAHDDYKDAERQKYILDQSEPLIIPTGGEKIGTMKFTTWNSMAQAMERAKLLEKDVNINDAYTTEFLK